MPQIEASVNTVRAIKPLKSLPREVMETSLPESFQNRHSNGKRTAGSNPVPAGSGHDDLITLFCLSFPRYTSLNVLFPSPVLEELASASHLRHEFSPFNLHSEAQC